MKKHINVALILIAGLSVISSGFAADKGKTSDKVVPYALDKCIVTGEKLGGMGEPVVKVYDGREVKFCCNGCVKKFEKDKDAYFQKIDDAIVAEQKPTYPLATCVVTGEKLDGGEMQAVDYVYNNRLVRFCCNGCISTFEKDPAKYLSKLDAAKSKSDEKKSQ